LSTRWRATVQYIKRESLTLYAAYRNPRTPWLTRLFLALVLAYAFSPIDLIPDFIPVLGYLDDALLLPLCIWLALRMIPEPVLADARREATARIAEARPVSRVGAVAIVSLWLLGIMLAGWWLLNVAIR
jgi:uncharacterized membrane protein YkvA (DUF1232 family)